MYLRVFSGIIYVDIMEIKEKKSLVEALLFVSGEPVALTVLKNISEMPEVELKQLLDDLIKDYKERDSGLHIVEIANGYQMVTNPSYAQWVRKLKSTSASNKLSLPALETLAIIAYNQCLERRQRQFV